MFSLNLFKRSLAEQKIALPIYLFGLGFYAWMMVAVYPSTKGFDLEEYWENFPEIMQKFFGAQELSISSLEGFLSVEYMLFWQMIIIAFTIAFATRSIVKEIEDGTMEIMLSYPISRIKFILTKIFAGVTGVIALAGISTLVLYLTTFTIEDSISFQKLAAVFVISFALFFSFLGINFFFSAIFSERSKAIFSGIAVLIVSYLLDVLSQISDKIEKFHFLSLFKYGNTEMALKDGTIEWERFLLLIGVGLVFFILATFIFKKRDIQGK